MSHPNPSHDRDNERREDSLHSSKKSPQHEALIKAKGFGSEYPGRKAIKRLLKKPLSYRLKHF